MSEEPLTHLVNNMLGLEELLSPSSFMGQAWGLLLAAGTLVFLAVPRAERL